jgi:hypothetical protein
MGVHPIGVYLMGIHLAGVHLMGVHLMIHFCYGPRLARLVRVYGLERSSNYSVLCQRSRGYATRG